MHLTNEEKRTHIEHEKKREAEEVGLSGQGDVACEYCEAELEEDHAHVIGGETFCATCALDEVTRLRTSATWSSLAPAQRLEAWEVLGAAANQLESALRTDIRRKAVQ